MPTQLFSLGRVVMTTNLQNTLTETIPDSWDQELKAMIERHVSGDWGYLEEFDQLQNAAALKDGSRLFSAYYTSDGSKVWVITEASEAQEASAYSNNILNSLLDYHCRGLLGKLFGKPRR